MRYLFPCLILALCTIGSLQAGTPVYKNSNALVSARVEDLLSRMTLHEKILQLQNREVGKPEGFCSRFNGESIGTVHEMSCDAAECHRIYSELQKYMTSYTRLGIPALTCVEGIEGILQNGATIFPQAIAQGSTFNPSLVGHMTEACAREAEAMGIHQILSPVLDIARELRWGRVEETFGEDPYLISEIATAFINGYQRNRHITCTPKHFVAHGSPTGGLNCAHVCAGEREFRSIYLYPFAKVIARTSPLSVMSCYSALDGVAVSGSHYYMTDVLRGELGFKGYVYSDWGSVDRLKTFHYAVDSRAEAARQSLIAGVDLDVDDAYSTLEEQVLAGDIDMDYIDTAVRRILYIKFMLGLFDAPYDCDSAACVRSVHCREHVDIAKAVADESAVLLENNGILPIDLDKYKKIAVVGPNGDKAVFGDYSWSAPSAVAGVSLYEGLKNRAGEAVEISFTQGCDWWSQDGSGIKDAVKAAEKSDLVIAAVGTRSTFLGRSPDKSTAGEGFDLSSLELPGRQSDLLKSLKATGKPIIVVLISGKPLIMQWSKENADAVLLQWYAGEQQGNAAADILLGNVNPSGRLNVSFPRSTGNLPCFYNYYPTDREYGNDRGGTLDTPRLHYVFEPPYALWPFGYGLSYTRFKYDNFRIRCEGDSVVVGIDVENVGSREGKEVVQLYVRDLISSVATPIQQLKAFEKVSLDAGEHTSVTLVVPFEELTLVDTAMKSVFENGDFEFQLGRSSAEILFRSTLTLSR